MPVSSLVKLKNTATSGTASAVSNQYVVVQSIDTQQKVAHVVNQVRATMQISLHQLIGKGVALPAAGETWLISSVFGYWMFIAQMAPSLTGPPTRPLPTPVNGWVLATSGATQSPAYYYKDWQNIVSFQGSLSNGTVGSAPALVMPSGYRPNSYLSFATICQGGIARVDVDTSGDVMIVSTAYGASSGSNSLVSLSGVSYLANGS